MFSCKFDHLVDSIISFTNKLYFLLNVKFDFISYFELACLKNERYFRDNRWIVCCNSLSIKLLKTKHSLTFLSLQEPLFYARIVYDLLFFFIIIIITLNLIFGVIIDTFADLRSEKQQKEEILKNSCFICGGCRTCVLLSIYIWI